MSKKISLLIGGKNFDIDVEEQFANFLEFQMAKDFNAEGNTEIKQLLQAYVRKNYELFSQDVDLKKLIQKLQN
ncbi:MAG: hypothetical protein GQ570_10715 [Helicobacteraceae bacterium]|nr:hypothetical protein [Helicobacteraceae bacterium]